jgi:hypothetical protein
MLAHARLLNHYFDASIRYAWMISNILPIRGVGISTEEAYYKKCTPYEKYFIAIPNLARFSVFGYPSIVKFYRWKSVDNEVLHEGNIIQRGIRGVFIGFPTNQAGWQVFIPTYNHVLISCDVAFDEKFESHLSFDAKMFHDAMPSRPIPPPGPVDRTIPLAHTGRRSQKSYFELNL